MEVAVVGFLAASGLVYLGARAMVVLARLQKISRSRVRPRDRRRRMWRAGTKVMKPYVNRLEVIKEDEET